MPMQELVHAQITSTSVILGGVNLCDIALVAVRGVTVIPGMGDDLNVVRVEFIVGTVEVEDDAL